MVVLAMPTFLPSRIEAVTVYRRGALVTRAVTIEDVNACGDVIRIGGLPLSLEESSVRVQISGQGLVAADVRLGLDVGAEDPELAPVESEELRTARRQLKALIDRAGHVEAQRRRLAAEITIPRPQGREGEAPPASPYRGRRAVGEFRREQLDSLDREAQAITVQLRAAKETLAEHEARDREGTCARQSKSHEMRRTAEIRLERRPGAIGRRELRLEYMIPGARWAPAYTVTFDRSMSRVNLALRAVVAQRSGEDWTRVRLTLSTADRQRWTELPELQSMRIGRRQTTPSRPGWRPAPTGAQALYADYDRYVQRHPPSESGARLGDALDELDELELDELDEEFDGSALDDLVVEPYAAAPEEEGARFDLGRAEPKMKKEAPGRARSSGYGAAQASPMAMAQGMAMPSAPPLGVESRGGLLSRLTQAGGGGPMDTGVFALEDAPALAEDPSALLAYGDLRMPAPTAADRGRLIMVRRQQRIRELVVLRESARIDELLTVLGDARRQAMRPEGASPPPGHAFPGSVEGFDYTYATEGLVDVLADGDFHGIPLLARDAEVTMHHVVVPRESTDVFRVASFKDPLAAPLLAGPADVYVGGDYLLTCDLSLTPAGGEVRLGLGVEQAIKVSRNTAYEEESAGLIGGSLLLQHQLTVELDNRLDRPMMVEVRERVPSLVSGEDDITVEVATASPGWQPYEPEEYTLKGGYRWRVEVAAGGRQRLRAAYTIKISAKKELVGGNRREV